MSDPQQNPLRFDLAGAPGATTCSACQQPIARAYYTVGDRVACESCKAQLEIALQQRPGFGGFLGALALGSAAGLLGAAVWYGVRTVTHYELGIIAIAIGFFVGLGVKRGSGGRGGLAIQLLAVALTYFWIAANYVPDVLAAFDENQAASEQEATQGGGKGPPLRAIGPQSDGGRSEAEPSEASEEGDPQEAAPRAVTVVAAFVMALALPFMMGFQNLIGILIIAFGLYQAWVINRRAKIEVAGPFSLGAVPRPAASV